MQYLIKSKSDINISKDKETAQDKLNENKLQTYVKKGNCFSLMLLSSTTRYKIIKVRCNFNSDETFNMLCIFYFIENEIKDKDWC